jgi:Mrp family chromosome partitioning ATPase
MSRNFELLQRAHSLMERTALFSAASAEGAAPQIAKPAESDAPEAGACFPSAALEASERSEILKLVCGIFQPGHSDAVRIVVVAGVDEHSSSTWITACAGELLSEQVREPVCVVDANFHQHGLNAMFGVENGLGLADAVLGNGSLRDYCSRMRGRLFLLSAGSLGGSRGDALPRESMWCRIQQLRREFGYAVIAAPPVAPCAAEVLALGQMSDGVLLVVEANTTRRDAALAAKEMLTNSKVPVLGAVLNNRTFPIPDNWYARL